MLGWTQRVFRGLSSRLLQRACSFSLPAACWWKHLHRSLFPAVTSIASSEILNLRQAPTHGLTLASHLHFSSVLLLLAFTARKPSPRCTFTRPSRIREGRRTAAGKHPLTRAVQAVQQTTNKLEHPLSCTRTTKHPRSFQAKVSLTF